jgi:hypothetical protein
MSKVYKSFTRTWIGFFSGDITEKDLNLADFEFGCSREHLFPSKASVDAIGHTYPAEVTWVPDPGVFPGHKMVNSGRVPNTYVCGEISDAFAIFINIIRDRLIDGHVKFCDDDERSRLVACRQDYMAEVVLAESIVTRRWEGITAHLLKWGPPDPEAVAAYYFWANSGSLKHPQPGKP